MNVETDFYKHTATITFDDKKTDVKTIINALEKGDFPVKGGPEFIL